MSNFEVQVRSEKTGIRTFPTIKEAFDFAETNFDVWKISFDAANGERVRLVRFGVSANTFLYEPIM